VNNRDQVVTDLNAAGYNYTDYSKYKEFNKLETYLHSILNIASVAFMVITALFILINMAKFVSEGRREIGIFRAIGASRMAIRFIFIVQSLAYIVISVITGAILGVLAIYGLSNVMLNSASSFIQSTVGAIINLTGKVTQSDFLTLDYKTLLIYAGILLVVTLVVSLIPSEQAARVSPVEAIRN
jgi:ABC-type lipoprotein release transport system permease subunit